MKKNIHLGVGSVSSLLVKFLTLTLVARIAGAMEMGLFITVIAACGIIVRIFDLSLAQACILMTRSNNKDYGACVFTLIGHAVLILPLFLLTTYLLRFLPFDTEASSDLFIECQYLISILMFFQLISGSLTALQPVLDRYKTFALMTIIPSLVNLSLIVLYSQYFGYRLTAYSLIYLLALSECVWFLFLMVYLKYRKEISLIQTQQLPLVVNLYRIGLQSHVGVVTKVVMLKADRILLSMLLSPEKIAYYSIATSVRDYLLTPGNIFGIKFQNKLIDINIKRENVFNSLERALMVWFGLLTLVCLGVILVSPYVIPAFFGTKFIATLPILNILVWSIVPIGLSGLCWNTFLAMNEPKLISKSIVIPSILGFACLMVLTDYYGLIGACIATFISSLLSFVFAYIYICRLRTARGLPNHLRFE